MQSLIPRLTQAIAAFSASFNTPAQPASTVAPPVHSSADADHNEAEVKVPVPTVTSCIAKDAKFVGNIVSEGGIRIDGTLIGDVTVIGNTSLLVIGEGAEMQGNITAPNVVIRGAVKGALIDADQIIFGAESVVRAEIRYTELRMTEGCDVFGKIERKVPAETAQVAPVSDVAPGRRTFLAASA